MNFSTIDSRQASLSGGNGKEIVGGGERDDHLPGAQATCAFLQGRQAAVTRLLCTPSTMKTLRGSLALLSSSIAKGRRRRGKRGEEEEEESVGPEKESSAFPKITASQTTEKAPSRTLLLFPCHSSFLFSLLPSPFLFLLLPFPFCNLRVDATSQWIII